MFDDIHWAEPTFLDLIEDILDAALGVPLLLLCTARHELHEDRPEFRRGATGGVPDRARGALPTA